MKLVSSIVLSKCEIMDSLLKEPYSPRRWSETGMGSLRQANECGTALCAVSNILRNHVDPSYTMQEFIEVCRSASAGVMNRAGQVHRDYFSDLISAFDHIVEPGEGGYKAPPQKRLDLLRYVESVFPDEVTVTSGHRICFMARGEK